MTTTSTAPAQSVFVLVSVYEGLVHGVFHTLESARTAQAQIDDFTDIQESSVL